MRNKVHIVFQTSRDQSGMVDDSTILVILVPNTYYRNFLGGHVSLSKCVDLTGRLTHLRPAFWDSVVAVQYDNVSCIWN